LIFSLAGENQTGFLVLGALHQQIRRTIRRHDLLPEGSRVPVGLSGGSDSVALTKLLLDLSEHGGFTVAACAHVNHELRASADRDEQFCGAFAARIGLPIHFARGGVQSYADLHRVSIEEAGRKIRYSFLTRVAETLGADRIAVGHTRDDQAETVLMKLMRGAGPAGLAGIYPRRGAVIRPLLDVSRTALREWLMAGSHGWVDDETNADLGNPRNRMRLRVLPEITLALGGDPTPGIARTAALLREDGEWLEATARREFDARVRQLVDGVAFEAKALAELPGPIANRVLRDALRAVAGGREVTSDHVDSARCVLHGHTGAADIPGGRMELSRGMLVLLERKAWP
jgi:tRNA(Ile)-lysidine synthase